MYVIFSREKLREVGNSQATDKMNTGIKLKHFHSWGRPHVWGGEVDGEGERDSDIDVSVLATGGTQTEPKQIFKLLNKHFFPSNPPKQTLIMWYYYCFIWTHFWCQSSTYSVNIAQWLMRKRNADECRLLLQIQQKSTSHFCKSKQP